MCMVACAGYIGIAYLQLRSSVQVIQILCARSLDHCTELESKVCATKSLDSPDPHFAQHIYHY